MRLYLDCYNTGDARYLLFDFNDIDFNPEDLKDAFDKIADEDSRITNNNEYLYNLENKASKKYREYEYDVLHLIKRGIALGCTEKVNELIKTFALPITPDFESVKHLINSYENIFRLENIREEQKVKEPVIWEELMVYIHSHLKVMPDYDCTVVVFRGYEKAVNNIIAAKAKQNAKTD